MLPIAPLVIPTMFILASSGGLCDMGKQPEINVIPQAEDTVYDSSQSLAQIQNYDMDTVNPYGLHHTTYTNAFMRGGVKMETEVSIMSRSSKAMGAGCLGYNQINVTLKLAPEIVIGHEIYMDACMRKSVLTHELKHVAVDRLMVNKYANIIGNKIYDTLKAQDGFVVGPIPLSRMDSTQAAMRKLISQIVDTEFQRLNLERRDRQQEVDSLGEYDSVIDHCPIFKRHANEIYGNLKK